MSLLWLRCIIWHRGFQIGKHLDLVLWTLQSSDQSLTDMKKSESKHGAGWWHCWFGDEVGVLVAMHVAARNSKDELGTKLSNDSKKETSDLEEQQRFCQQPGWTWKWPLVFPDWSPVQLLANLILALWDTEQSSVKPVRTLTSRTIR